jgi:hypothetical protein
MAFNLAKVAETIAIELRMRLRQSWRSWAWAS